MKHSFWLAAGLSFFVTIPAGAEPFARDDEQARSAVDSEIQTALDQARHRDVASEPAPKKETEKETAEPPPSTATATETQEAPKPATEPAAEPAPEPAAPTEPRKHEAGRHEHDNKHDDEHEEDIEFENYFAVTGSYAQIGKSVTDVETNSSYSLSSNPAYSLELAWNHHWNRSFYTLASYTFTQVSSNETSALTGSKVIDNMTLGMAELALLNRVTRRLGLGLGVAYGDHIFVENFVNVPRDPSIYRNAFFNPYLMAEWTFFDSRALEGNLEVKIDSLPAQVGNGHDLTSGYAFSAQASLLEKFTHWALFYGVKYETENQTRTDANETSTRWDLRVGALF